MSEVLEQIRSEVEALEYEPLGPYDLAQMKQRVSLASNNNAIEDAHRTDEEVALDDLLIDLRAPKQVRMYASRRYLELQFYNGRSLKGTIFPECVY